MIGQTLSHYRITAALGAGGMGEVYRATDTKLGRDVAIKVLPPEVAQDPERLGRFQREAHLLAALNHPHIAAIHGLEEADGKPFLVLELVEGEDLKQRLERGPIPVDEALEIAEQVAEALEEAHNKGIVHRDLKPANVKLTPDGKVKVLDFGLAKAWAGDAAGGPSSASMSESPTLAHSGTQAGVILGTAAYMSPEQARGKAVDRRADVWAFGVLLWEMLTSQALFTGETVTDVIAAVVTREPELDALPADTPRVARRLLTRCLRKDPRTRLPDIGAARLDLQEVLTGSTEEDRFIGSDEEAAGTAVSRRLARQRWALAGAWLVTAGVAAYFALVHRSETTSPPAAARFVVEAPEGWSFCPGCWPVPSPDGRQVLMLAERTGPEGDVRSVWLRSVDSLNPRPLTTMGHPESPPFWSPDSRFIGFTAEGELRKLNLNDGIVQTICTLPTRDAGRADWSADGTIVFAGVDPDGLYSVPATGGEAKLLLEPDAERGEDFFNVPQFLPDGRRLLFIAVGRRPGFSVSVMSLDSPEDRRQVATGTGFYQLAGDRLAFNRDGTLFAQPFDPDLAEVSGEPVSIASSLLALGPRAVGAYGISAEGTLAYLSGQSDPRRQLAWVDRKGVRIETIGEPRRYAQIALSPDERRVAAEVRDPDTIEIDLWVTDLARGVASRVTSDPGDEQDPVWSPDSQEIAYWSTSGGDNHLFRKGMSGQPAVPVPGARGTDDATRDRPEGWSPDGTALLVKKLDGTTVWALPLKEGGEIETVLDLEHRLDEPQVSPDERWLAYASEESGDRWEVYLQPYRRPGERVRVSLQGGGQPNWRGDSRELFFLAADGRVMAVDVREGTAGPEVSLPTALFELEPSLPWLDHYAVSADGQRFLVRQPLEQEDELKMHVVLNWTSLLE